MAAGSAKPMVARPLEMSSRRGWSTSHSGITASMCAPASTVAIVSGGVCARVTAATCCGASVPGAALAASASRRAASARAARPAPGAQRGPAAGAQAASSSMAAGSGAVRVVAPVK